MGFDDIKTDGLSKDLIDREREALLNEYFGVLSLDSSRSKGQYEKFEELKKAFIDMIQAEFIHYFEDRGWTKVDVQNGINMRANEKNNIILSLWSNEIFVNVNNERLKYKFQIVSDFQKLGYYKKSDRGSGWTHRYERCGGTPISLKVLQQELEEMKEIFKKNAELKQKYNFRLSIYGDDKDEESVEYTSIKLFLEDLDKKI